MNSIENKQNLHKIILSARKSNNNSESKKKISSSFDIRTKSSMKNKSHFYDDNQQIINGKHQIPPIIYS